ncbi:MAG TPA: hypothetical protein DEO84_06985 [candidate division Zixibacteria bacterium]|nr:hypothetical protein [candidate division Zixibacteria bacterium]
MATVIRNLYKAVGLFSCHHPAHKQFGYEVSPYHIFCIKRCHGKGCVEFLWRCHTFEKGQACPRGFQHVGRGCFSCKQYHEIKENYLAESTLDKAELAEFIDALREYQGWLESMDGRLIEFAGDVDSVTPHLEMHIEPEGRSVEMDGFYVTFDSGHIDRDLFDDRLYLKLSGNQLERLAIAPGDHLECKAYFTESRGRIILRKPKQIEITHNGGKLKLSVSRALVGRATGKIISGPVEPCKGCSYISLVDITDNRRQHAAIYRRFYCLRGVDDAENCPVRLARLVATDQSI